MTDIDSAATCALADPKEVARRLELLGEAHMLPLNNLVRDIRRRHAGYKVPYPDPLDGGAAARALLLLEAPGPKAVATQFVSINNPDPTAKNLHKLLRDARIDRRDVLVWNIVPWYVGDGKRIRPVRRADISEACVYLDRLLDMLEHLKEVMLVGRKAQLAAGQLEGRGLNIAECFHPSPQVFHIAKDKKAQTEAAFRGLSKRLK